MESQTSFESAETRFRSAASTHPGSVAHELASGVRELEPDVLEVLAGSLCRGHGSRRREYAGREREAPIAGHGNGSARLKGETGRGSDVHFESSRVFKRGCCRRGGPQQQRTRTCSTTQDQSLHSIF